MLLSAGLFASGWPEQVKAHPQIVFGLFAFGTLLLAIGLFWPTKHESKDALVQSVESGNVVGRDNSGKMIFAEHYHEAPPRPPQEPPKPELPKNTFIDILPSPPTPAPSKLYIHSAEYISTVDPTRRVDVTECLRLLIADDKLALEIQNHNFVAGGKNYAPTDPHPYKKKKLYVIYSFNNGPLQEVTQLEETFLSLPQVEAATSNFVRLDLTFERMDLMYKPEHCAWDQATQFDDSRRQALIGWIANPVAPPGVRGVDASRLSAHLKYSVEGKWNAQVSRGYWLHHSANEIAIIPGDRAGLILGLVDWSHWVSYANPYFQSPNDGILGPAFRDHGKEEKMPLADMDIEISLISNGALTLDQRKFRLCFTNGRPSEVRPL